MSNCEKCGSSLTEKETSKVKIQIKNRFTGNVIFESSKETIKEAVLEAKESDANLSSANLSDANLSGANLSGANLIDAKNAELAIAKTRILAGGDLIGWKKCKRETLVKLCIPADAKRSHAFGRKCRAEFVKVLEVIGGDIAISIHDGQTKYKAGEIVRADKWCDNWQQECAGGIHFYITRIEAENHS